jgi:FkbM family methyltransferase
VLVANPDHVAAAVRRYTPPLIEACVGSRVNVAGLRIRIPGRRSIRLSVVAGNIRLHRLFDSKIRTGATVVDVGANVGYNTVYAARLVGRGGRIVAVEPAADNVRVLRENVNANGLDNVAIHEMAVGRTHEIRDLFLRGETSAVNSLFQPSVYAAVTGVVRVAVAPLDDLVDGHADLVKIDVEGAEIEVLDGMTRLLQHPAIGLIVEWHPRLQEAAGCPAGALPAYLLDRGFRLHAASHTRVRPLRAADIAAWSEELRRTGHPVELIATRAEVSVS